MRAKNKMEERNDIALLIWLIGMAIAIATYLLLHGADVHDDVSVLKGEPIKKTPVEEIITETEVIEKEAPKPSDEDLIAAVVMAEAGNQEMVGKVAVAMVVLNRCDKWGMTVESVVSQEGQFAYPYYGTVNEDCYTAVRIAQENRELFPEDMVYFRNTKFHDFGIPYLQIQGHYFSTEDK
jgi:hypothetical protein